MITLEQLLESRDNRFVLQHRLLENNPGCTLVCFTVQLPGAEKRNALSLSIAEAGQKALQDAFGQEPHQIRDLETGYEAYFLVQAPAEAVKRQCCTLEETHPLGRLMDIDVIGPDGPVSRTEVGYSARKCLLCGEPARVCMRARTHTSEELLRKIKQMIC
ncbi:MAG: citrate lyase holo-[Bacteroidales bacterium]|nr:citrate lyase holo-[acyl-carrier protein] synthase [Bacteroidales bacterium]